MASLRGTIRRTLAIIVKEFKHIRFDPGFLFLTLLAPAVMLTMLAYVFSSDVDRANVAVLDQDRSQQSAEYLRTITADGDVRIIAEADTYDQVIELFQSGRADAALVIPPDFGRQLNGHQQAEVNLIVDGSDSGTAFQIQNAIQQRTEAYAAGFTQSGQVPFEARLRVWFNENLDSQWSMVPGLMALVLILPAMAVALGIAREKETGTFETLITTPIRGREYLIGKLVVYLIMGLIGALLALAVAVFWFGVPFRGGLGIYLLLTGDYLLALMGFSLVIANFIESQRTVTAIILLSLFIPSFFLTGLMLPVDESSIVSRALAFSIPSTHFIEISRSVTLKGSSLPQVWPDALVLFVFGIVAVVLSVTLFSKKVG